MTLERKYTCARVPGQFVYNTSCSICSADIQWMYCRVSSLGSCFVIADPRVLASFTHEGPQPGHREPRPPRTVQSFTTSRNPGRWRMWARSLATRTTTETTHTLYRFEDKTVNIMLLLYNDRFFIAECFRHPEKVAGQ